MSAADAPAPDRPAAPSFHEAAYRVRFDEAGPDGQLRTSGFMRYAQDLAWLHSTALGFGREWYAERGLTWLVRAAELVVLAPVPMGATIGARTRSWDFRVRSPAWIVPPRRRIAGRVGSTPLVLIHARGALTASHRSSRRPHGHAKNAIYLDWLEESLPATAAADAGAIPRRYRLEYAAAEAGAPPEAAAWPVDDDGWNVRLPPTDRPAQTCSGARLEREPARHSRSRIDDPDRVQGGRVFDGTGATPPGRTSPSRVTGSSPSGPGSTATRSWTSPAGRSCRARFTATPQRPASSSNRRPVGGWTQQPFLLQFDRGCVSFRKTLEIGITVDTRRRRRRPRNLGRRLSGA